MSHPPTGNDLRMLLQKARAQTAELTAQSQRLQDRYTRLRRAVRTQVLAAVENGSLRYPLAEVDQALRDWGLPGLPEICVATVRAPFAMTVSRDDAPGAERAADLAEHQFWKGSAGFYDTEVNVARVEFDPPEFQAAARRDKPASYRITGRLQLDVIVRATDPADAARLALPIARLALPALRSVSVDADALAVVRAAKAGFDPNVDPDTD